MYGTYNLKYKTIFYLILSLTLTLTLTQTLS